MAQIILGLLSLATLSMLAGVAIHWAVGFTMFALPIAVAYVRIKFSGGFRASCDEKISEVLRK